MTISKMTTWRAFVSAGLPIAAALASTPVPAAEGGGPATGGNVPANAGNGDPCGGIRPCDLGGTFTINDMLAQKPYPIRGVCESRCFWQAVVTNSCFYPDAIIDIHAPVDANTGELNRRAADILISETKPPGVQQFLKTSGAGYRTELTRLSGRDLIAMGAPSCR
jgi:hypothetical protein